MNEELRREKARKLRYRKAAARGITIEEITTALYDIQDKCMEIIWWCDEERDCVEALIGDEGNGTEFRMQMADLEGDVENMLSDLNEAYVSENFDAFFVDMVGGSRSSQLMWYDEDEGDYFGLEPWDNSEAKETSRKKLLRLTKEELLDATANCLKIYTSFLSLQTRAAELEAALDILRDKNGDVLRCATSLNEAYEKWCRGEEMSSYEEYSEFKHIAELMPPEAWLM